MALKVHVYIRGINAVSPFLEAAVAGFKRHGIDALLLPPHQVAPCDLAVVWGVRKRPQMQSGRRALVLERGYVGDRFQWTSMGFDGLNGKADFRNANMPGDRWRRLFSPLMKPWRGHHDGDYVLLLGQVTGDASHAGIVNIHRWYEQVGAAMRKARLPVRYRAHPLEKAYSYHPALKPIGGTLADNMRGARWVVSYNSNSSLDAVLAGIPAVAVDRGAMAFAVTGHDPCVAPPMPDRTQWAHDLAWTQWAQHEIAAGDAWDHLKVGMEQEIAA